jgi:hypothetical protein
MKYNIGDKFWRVNKIFNRLTGAQKKLKMVDADGVEWYRYDKDTVEFDIAIAEIVGIFKAVIEGESIWEEEEYCDRYAVRIGDAVNEVWEEELDGEHRGHYVSYFQTKEDAEEYIKEQSEYHNGL